MCQHVTCQSHISLDGSTRHSISLPSLGAEMCLSWAIAANIKTFLVCITFILIFFSFILFWGSCLIVVQYFCVRKQDVRKISSMPAPLKHLSLCNLWLHSPLFRKDNKWWLTSVFSKIPAVPATSSIFLQGSKDSWERSLQDKLRRSHSEQGVISQNQV